MKVTIIGSTSYQSKMEIHKRDLEHHGNQVKLPAFDDFPEFNELQILEYNKKAIEWADESINGKNLLISDERLAYNARALFDFEKKADLPYYIVNEILPGPSLFNMLEEEWMTIGVNDYPRGHPVLNSTYVSQILSVSDILYVGGPSSNQISDAG